MRICFYWFNLAAPPGMSIGVSILARKLADAGHEVHVLHLNERVGLPLDIEQILAHPEVVGAGLHALSFGLNHAQPALALAALLKDRFGDSQVLCGGVHTTLNAEAVLCSPGVDFVGLGEVDDMMVPFVEALEGAADPAGILGFWTQHGGKIRRNFVPPLPTLDTPSPPFFDGIDYRRIIAANRGFAETIVGRGCAMSCNYCHNAAIVETLSRHSVQPVSRGAFLRKRRVEHAIEELAEFEQRYGAVIQAYVFGDDTFAGSRDWLREFGRRYAAEIGKPFICNAIAEQIDAEVATILADAGCNMVKFGVESGSDRVRREVLNRRLSEERLARAVDLLHERGINSRAYVMIGAPGETPAELASTYQLCARLRFDSVRPSILYPFPGTELHRCCKELGLLAAERATTDYSSTTVLALPEPLRRAIEQTAVAYAWLLNLELGGAAAEAARPLIDDLHSLDASAWTVAEGRRRITQSGKRVHERLLTNGVDHYYAPFSDRPDVIFLYRDRVRPLINVES